MSDPSDPPRIAEDEELPRGLSVLFASAREDVATREELAPTWRELDRRIGEPLPSSPTSFPWKLAGALAVTLAVGSVSGWLLSRPDADKPPPSQDAVVTPVPTVASSAAEPDEDDLPASSDPEPRPAPAETPPSPTRREAGHARPGADGEPSEMPSPPPSPSEGTGMTALEEGTLLLAARRALPTAPERALALTREHAARAPDGRLAQEREAIAIEALGRTGRDDEAGARARRFLERWPDSPHRSIAARRRDARSPE